MKAHALAKERIMPLVRGHDGKLRIGQVFIDDICTDKSTGERRTPLYAYSRARIEENYRGLYDALAKAFGSRSMRAVINYACKANTNQEILKILRKLGANIDAVTKEEVEIALASGFKPEQIFYTGVSNSPKDLNWLVENGVQINFDDLADLEKLSMDNKGRITIASFRVIPNVSAGHHAKTHTGHSGSKFGVPNEQVVDAYKKAKALGFKQFGIHCHIGSGSLEAQPFVDAAKAMVKIMRRLKKRLGIEVSYVDLGGGFGVPYKPGEKELDIQSMAEKVAETLDNGLRNSGYSTMPVVHFEPGRYIVCDAGVIATTVNTVKNSSGKLYALVDASMATLLRPSMYGSYHHILKDGQQGGTRVKYTVAGRVCESGDILGENRELPELKQGDLLIVLNTGAYGYTMALGGYNSIGFPEEVLVDGNSFRTIGNRVEGIELRGLTQKGLQ